MELSRIETTPSWYLRTFFQGRVNSSLGRPANTRIASTQVEFFDRKLNLFLSARQLSAFRGIFVEQEYDIRQHLPETLDRPKILDLGANVGLSAAYMWALFPGCEIVRGEPDSRNLPLLERTIVANELDATISLEDIASQPGTLRLRIGENSTCSVMEIHPNTTAEGIGGFLAPHGLNLKQIGFGNEPVCFASRGSQDS